MDEVFLSLILALVFVLVVVVLLLSQWSGEIESHLYEKNLCESLGDLSRA